MFAEIKGQLLLYCFVETKLKYINNTVVLCYLTKQARSPFVLKHITSWRVSGASETVLGVDNAKLGIWISIGEWSERDSIRGGWCKIGYMLYVYMYDKYAL